MAQVRLSGRALSDLERIFEFVAEVDPKRGMQTIQRIRQGLLILEHHPLIGRPAEEGRRELVMGRGPDAYLALYRWLPTTDTALILAIRNAREAGYREL